MSISVLLRLARQSADLPCQGLAKMTGLTQASISLAERGEFKFSDRTRVRVLTVLLREVSRAQDVPVPPCSNERDTRRELSRLCAAAEVVRAELSLQTANAVLASWA